MAEASVSMLNFLVDNGHSKYVMNEGIKNTTVTTVPLFIYGNFPKDNKNRPIALKSRNYKDGGYFFGDCPF
jgi:hypothetical protein